MNSDTSGNTADLFITKYNTNGNVIWAKNAGGIYSENATSIAIDATNNLYIVGTFGKKIAFGTIILTNADTLTNYQDLFLAKYNSSGNVLWAKRAGGTNNDYPYSVAMKALGGVYIAGNFESSTLAFDTTTLINAGNPDVFLAKYDTSGNVLWAKRAGGTGYDYPYF